MVGSLILAPERVGVVLMLAGVSDGVGALVCAWGLGWGSLVGRVGERDGGKKE